MATPEQTKPLHKDKVGSGHRGRDKFLVKNGGSVMAGNSNQIS